MGNYIKWIRGRVGHDTIILNFSVACIINQNGEILLQKRSDKDDIWGLPGGALKLANPLRMQLLERLRKRLD